MFIVFGLCVARYRDSGVGCKAGLDFEKSESCEGFDCVPDGSRNWSQSSGSESSRGGLVLA